MIPPSSESSAPQDIAHGVVALGKRERCDTGSSRGSGPVLSMDLFRSDNFQLDGLRSEDILLDGGLGALCGEDANPMFRIRSSEFAKDVLMPDTVVAAATAMKTGQPSTTSYGTPPSQQQKISKLKAKLERRCTGDDLVPLNMNFRISSSGWATDYEAESYHLVASHPSLFLDNQSSLFTSNAPPPLNSPKDTREEYQVPRRSSISLRSSRQESRPMPRATNARISSSDWIKDFEGQPVDLEPIHPSLFMRNASFASTAAQLSTSPLPFDSSAASHEACERAHVSPQHPPTPIPSSTNYINKNILPSTSPTVSSTKTYTSPPASIANQNGRKKKKNRKRMLDETRVAEPADGDVLCGRGGFTNKHPGNIRFREKALEFRPWYEESSKEKKQEIANLLVESVGNEGYRFLGKSEDGLWHEMIGNGPHYKASQSLRERIKGGK